MDATVGAGGHAELSPRTRPGVRLLGIDRDPDALALRATRLAPFAEPRRAPRRRLRGARRAALRKASRADGILADLGVSSMQLDRGERGFSFGGTDPSTCAWDRNGRTAADIVATASVEELTRIFRDYGEERMAAKIARGIVAERTRGPSRRLAISPASWRGEGEPGEDRSGDPGLPGAADRGQPGARRARPVPRRRRRPPECRRPPRGDLVSLSRGPDREGCLPPGLGTSACARRSFRPASAGRARGAAGADVLADPARRSPELGATRSRSARLRVAEKLASDHRMTERCPLITDQHRLRPDEAGREPALYARARPPPGAGARDLPPRRIAGGLRAARVRGASHRDRPRGLHCARLAAAHASPSSTRRAAGCAPSSARPPLPSASPRSPGSRGLRAATPRTGPDRRRRKWRAEGSR